jgi:hypothetical protein
MLTLNVQDAEYFDERTSEFVIKPGFLLELEHSLKAVSKWESIFNKPFLTSSEKTVDEMTEYIVCMSLSPISTELLTNLKAEDYMKISEYLKLNHTATTFSDKQQRGNRTGELVTSELIYYWMLTFSVPFECEEWNLNRLFTLLRICSIKNSKQKTMPKRELAAQNSALNKARLNRKR